MNGFESIKQVPTLLVVDDTEDNLDLLEFALKKKPVKMIRATSGKECLEKAESDRPDIILLDIQMPEMDGFETLKLLRTNLKTSGIPVIFLTANRKDPQSIAQGILAGAEEFLTKPIDIDELLARVQSIYKMAAMQRELEQTKTRFTAMLVHDLRNPLTVILSGIDYLMNVMEDKNELDGDRREIMAKMMNSTAGMINLVNEILDLSKYQAGQIKLEKKKAHVETIINESLHLIQLQFKRKHLHLETHFAPNLLPIDADAKKIEQVISNLLGNAHKFTHAGGTVKIFARNGENNTVTITISDTGVGMKKDDLPYIFEHFRQGSSASKTKEKGTGLGLAICRLIVQAHGGKISVDSEEGKGTIFTVTLPAAL